LFLSTAETGLPTRRDILATAALTASPTIAWSSGDIAGEALQLLDAQPHLRTGEPGEIAVAELIRRVLAAANFSVTEQKITLSRFRMETREISWEGGATKVEVQAYPDQPSDRVISARSALLRPGDHAGLAKGRIAVQVLPHKRHSQLLARDLAPTIASVVEAKAAALVLVTEGPSGETVFLNLPAETKDLPNFPIAVVGPREAGELVEAARDGRPMTLSVADRSSTVSSNNVIGSVDRGTPYLIVSTPRTAWTPAVAERGPGLASFLELATWAPTALPRTSLMFVSTTAHEYDNAGSQAFLNVHAPSGEEVGLWLHLGAGFGARDFHEFGGWRLQPLPGADSQRFLVGSPELLSSLKAAFRGQPGLENPYPASGGAAGELEEILKKGYPRTLGLFGAHRFHHTMSDRLDKVSPSAIADVVTALKSVIQSTFAAAPGRRA
jgi:hypothetical protein